MVAYEAKFTELSRFAPHIVVDEATTQKFLRGLKPEIHTRLTPIMLTNCTDIVNGAQIIEQDCEIIRG